MSGPRWRWKVAGVLNRLPRTCWANLVGWALADRGQKLIDLSGNQEDVRQDWMCRSANDTGRCYCSKLKVPTHEEATR